MFEERSNENTRKGVVKIGYKVSFGRKDIMLMERKVT
jgi:hypothetical protein